MAGCCMRNRRSTNGGWIERQVKQPLFEKSGAKTFFMLGHGRWRRQRLWPSIVPISRQYMASIQQGISRASNSIRNMHLTKVQLSRLGYVGTRAVPQILQDSLPRPWWEKADIILAHEGTFSRRRVVTTDVRSRVTATQCSKLSIKLSQRASLTRISYAPFCFFWHLAFSQVCLSIFVRRSTTLQAAV